MKPLLLLCIVGALASCSTRTQTIADSYNAVFGQYNREELFNLAETTPYTSAFYSINSSPMGFVVLGYAEPVSSLGIANDGFNQLALKWVTGNRYMLVTRGGRVVKSLRLPIANVDSVQSNTPDPLLQGLHQIEQPQTWHWQISWEPNHHQRYDATSVFTNLGRQTLDLFSGSVSAVHVQEHVTISQVGVSYTNEYWVHPEQGHVLQTRQLITPVGPEIFIELAKPYGGGL